MSVMQAEPTVYVVDDEPTICDAISGLLAARGMDSETFDSAEEFLDRYDIGVDRPGCLLLDIRMPGMSGLELQRELRRREIGIPIIFLTANADVRTAVASLKGGATEYIEKPFQADSLLSAIDQAIEKDCQTRGRTDELLKVRSRLATLSPREREVLDMVLDGVPTKNIARELGTSFETVKNQRSSILKKMHADNAVELARVLTLLRVGGQT